MKGKKRGKATPFDFVRNNHVTLQRPDTGSASTRDASSASH